MALVSCENVGQDLISWLNNASPLQRERLCKKLNCHITGLTQVLEIATSPYTLDAADAGSILYAKAGATSIDVSALPVGTRVDIYNQSGVTVSVSGHNCLSGAAMSIVRIDSGTLFPLGGV